MLTLENIGHAFDKVAVLDDINLMLNEGEVLCLLGASGSGKSTLLRIIAGLEPMQRGKVSYGGQVLAEPGAEPPPEQRDFGLVFQDHVLFPHFSVFENVAFGLQGQETSSQSARVEEMLSVVGLGDFAQRYPHTLSGGQQQRVALARALAPKPRLMLLDEPFASVDSTLRRALREDTRRALRSANVAAIVVTHDAEEAMELADRIAIIDHGQIVQIGTPEEIWAQPASCFVAEVVCGSEAIPGKSENGRLITAFGEHEFAGLQAGDCQVVVRPNSVTVQATEDPAATVEDIRFLGDAYRVVLLQNEQRLRVRLSQSPDVEIGSQVRVDFDSDGTLVYFAPKS